MSGPGRTFIFAGGGTGGHIFPALAIAEQLRARTECRCVFLCSDRPLDARILGREGVEFRVIPAKPVGMRPRALFRFLRAWGPSVRAVRALIREYRAGGGRVDVVAMGGFVAAPAAMAARRERATLTLVNMDVVPGKANRWIAGRADRIVTSAPVPGSAWPSVPPIVRSAARARQGAAACRTALGLDPAKATLLVTGASQGAKSINDLMLGLVREHAVALKGWQIVHQTGGGEDERVRKAYEVAGIPAEVRPFFEGMDAAWGAADLAVSRAGAGSVAEAWANLVPTVFLPYPYHKDEHQRHNARPLAEAGAAIIVKDRIDAGENLREAGAAIRDLLERGERRDAMRAACRGLGPVDGAERIAAMLISGS